MKRKNNYHPSAESSSHSAQRDNNNRPIHSRGQDNHIPSQTRKSFSGIESHNKVCASIPYPSVQPCNKLIKQSRYDQISFQRSPQSHSEGSMNTMFYRSTPMNQGVHQSRITDSGQREKDVAFQKKYEEIYAKLSGGRTTTTQTPPSTSRLLTDHSSRYRQILAGERGNSIDTSRQMRVDSVDKPSFRLSEMVTLRAPSNDSLVKHSQASSSQIDKNQKNENESISRGKPVKTQFDVLKSEQNQSVLHTQMLQEENAKLIQKVVRLEIKVEQLTSENIQRVESLHWKEENLKERERQIQATELSLSSNMNEISQLKGKVQQEFLEIEKLKETLKQKLASSSRNTQSIIQGTNQNTNGESKAQRSDERLPIQISSINLQQPQIDDNFEQKKKRRVDNELSDGDSLEVIDSLCFSGKSQGTVIEDHSQQYASQNIIGQKVLLEMKSNLEKDSRSLDRPIAMSDFCRIKQLNQPIDQLEKLSFQKAQVEQRDNLNLSYLSSVQRSNKAFKRICGGSTRRGSDRLEMNLTTVVAGNQTSGYYGNQDSDSLLFDASILVAPNYLNHQGSKDEVKQEEISGQLLDFYNDPGQMKSQICDRRRVFSGFGDVDISEIIRVKTDQNYEGSQEFHGSLETQAATIAANTAKDSLLFKILSAPDFHKTLSDDDNLLSNRDYFAN